MYILMRVMRLQRFLLNTCAKGDSFFDYWALQQTLVFSLQFRFVCNEHFARFGTTAGSNDASTFHLVHQAPCAVVTNREFALNQGG